MIEAADTLIKMGLHRSHRPHYCRQPIYSSGDNVETVAAAPNGDPLSHEMDAELIDRIDLRKIHQKSIKSSTVKLLHTGKKPLVILQFSGRFAKRSTCFFWLTYSFEQNVTVFPS